MRASLAYAVMQQMGRPIFRPETFDVRPISGFYNQNLNNYTSFVAGNYLTKFRIYIFFRLGIRAILVLKMGIENN